MRPFQSIHFAATTPGTRLIVTGAVHGNETCGTVAIRRVIDEIEQGRLSIAAGAVSFVPVTNPGPLEPFTQTAREEGVAARLGVHRIVDGWLGTYAAGGEQQRARQAGQGEVAPDLHADYGVGTTEYMRRTGGWALTLECGQHDDPQSPEVAYRAIVNTLAHLRLIDAPEPPAANNVEALRLFQVIDRHHAGEISSAAPGRASTWCAPARRSAPGTTARG